MIWLLEKDQKIFFERKNETEKGKKRYACDNRSVKLWCFYMCQQEVRFLKGKLGQKFKKTKNCEFVYKYL